MKRRRKRKPKPPRRVRKPLTTTQPKFAPMRVELWGHRTTEERGVRSHLMTISAPSPGCTFEWADSFVGFVITGVRVTGGQPQ